jgi:hypothetical protein
MAIRYVPSDQRDNLAAMPLLVWTSLILISVMIYWSLTRYPGEHFSSWLTVIGMTDFNPRSSSSSSLCKQISPHCVVYAQPARDGKAKEPQVGLLRFLNVVCGKCRLTVGAYATNDDPGYDTAHQQQ